MTASENNQPAAQATWQRSTLLWILGYEAAGSLTGGSMLISEPDGRLMAMPVDIMHGAFPDFLIPGIILFGLGMLTTAAFLSVFKRKRSDWFFTGLALGGLFIWFWVEIAILRELHWLHAMWGIPVLLGWILAIPLIALRHEPEPMRRALLGCGIVSSLWYAGINIFVPAYYEGYSMISVTVSELSAIGAPTRILWLLLVVLYPLLFAAFGWGVWQSASGKRSLKIMAALIIAYSILNFYWPPMHQRDVLAAGGGTLTDTLHIAWATITLAFMMLLMASGAAGSGKSFRMYTLVTWICFVLFGILAWAESPGIEANLPTPWIGLWERLNIGLFMLWIMLFAGNLISSKGSRFFWLPID